jgi:cellulose synthase/poly-beta-1,6-N-acetylglucosamine synthase-like glycosyltransferase
MPMIDLVSIFILILLILGLLYVLIIGLYTIGWFRLIDYVPESQKFKTRISVIIPARNEQENILKLLTDLKTQDYPISLYEIIVVDDNSTDNTALLVESFIHKNKDYPIHLIKIHEDKLETAYKKKAINTAINNSKGELIITTDADCRIRKQWLSTFAGLYEKYKPKMIVGPVIFHNEKSLFEKMQTIEFLSLIAITGGAIKIGKPVMCNGANLAYERQAFYDVGEFSEDNFSSGDDVFLLLKIRKQFGNKSVRFLKNTNALVFTEAKKTIGEFYHQRVRWASKNKGYDAGILFVSVTVYLTNLLILTGLLSGFLIIPLLLPSLIAFVAKAIIDLPIILGIIKFVDRKNLIFYSFPLALLYPLYIVIIGALGILGNYNWKGRKVSQ